MSLRANGWTLDLTTEAEFGVSTALIVTNYAPGIEGTAIYIGGTSEVEHVTMAHAKDIFGNNDEEIATASDTHRVLSMGLTKLGGDTEDVVLEGAQFKMYRDETGTQPIVFTYDASSNSYVVTDYVGTYTDTITVGTATIKGLGDGEYWFEETQAPEGYNPLLARVSHSLTNDSDLAVINNVEGVLHYVSGGLAVINNIGIIIPGTGGIGTVIFSLLGAGIVIAAVVYRMQKRKSHSNIDTTV